MHIDHRGLTHLASNIASIATCSASHASSILRCLCRTFRWRSFSFLPPPAGWGWGSVCCVAAEGSTGRTASSTVLRRPALADGSVLGRLPCPRDVLASPLLLPAAAALLDGPPPPPLAFPFPFCYDPHPEHTTH